MFFLVRLQKKKSKNNKYDKYHVREFLKAPKTTTTEKSTAKADLMDEATSLPLLFSEAILVLRCFCGSDALFLINRVSLNPIAFR